MQKKIMLFGVGLVLAVGGFAAYAYVTGASLFGAGRAPAETGKRHPQLETETDIANPSFETRDADMRLEYVLSAKSAHPVGNGKHMFDLVEPRITYYTKDGNLIVVTADAGQVAVDITAGTESKMQPKGGKLSQNVCLTEGPQDSFVPGATDRQPRQVQARFASDIDFSYADRTLESKGAIHVRGDRISFDGENLTLLFNTEQRRIEYLRIDRGDRIVIKDVLANSESPGGALAGPAHAGESATPAEAPPANPVAAGNPPASPTPASPAPSAVAKTSDFSTVYRLVFGQDVKAILGDRTLTSDEMSLVFQGSASDAAGKNSPPTVAAAPAAPAAPTVSSADLPGPLAGVVSPTPAAAAAAPATPPQDLILTWQGPMEMRPLADNTIKLNNSKDYIFEAASHQGRPVLMTEGDTRVLRSGHVWYHVDSTRLHLDPAELGQVEMTDSALGHMVCQGVDYSEANGTLHIVGPGQLEARSGALSEAGVGMNAAPAQAAEEDKQPVVAKFTQAADITLIKVPDIKNPKKTTQIVRRAVLNGDADVRDPTFWIHADTLDALVAHADVPTAGAVPTGDAAPAAAHALKTRQALEHLLATGAVKAQSYHGGAATPQNPDIVQGDRLELSTALSPETKLPVPNRLVVDGHVLAIANQPDKKDPKHLLQDQIMTPHLVVSLEPKPNDASATADPSPRQAFGGVAVKELDATGGTQLKLEGYDKQPVLATADSLHADSKAGTAILRGVPASPAPADTPARPARLEMGENHLVGMTLLLDQKAQTVDVPGPGEFVFLQPARQSDTKKEDTPVQVNWETSMKYDGKNLFADFVGSIHAKLLGKPDQDSELTSDNLHVRMAAAGTAKNTGDADTENFGAPRPAEIRAIGHVRADGATYDAQHNYLTRMLLTDVDLLVYSEETKMLVIPGRGQMLMEDRRPEPSQTQPAHAAGNATAQTDPSSARGKTAFAWTESLSYAGDTGLIHMKKDVVMHHVPLKPIRLTAHSAPGKPEDKSTKLEGGLADAGKLPPIENVWLKCNDLVATVVSAKNASSNPVTLGANEGSRLTKMIAQGNGADRAVLDMSPVELAAEILEYDALTNKAIATSRPGSHEPAHAESPAWGMLNAEQIIWDMTKDPSHKDEAITLIRPRLTSAQ